MDGFFPFELKEEFPTGTAFALVDKTSLTYAQDTGPALSKSVPAVSNDGAFQAFCGQGNRISASYPDAPLPGPLAEVAGGGSGAPPVSRAISSLASVGSSQVALSAESLLGALPDVCIRDGRVIDVRAGVAKLLFPAAAPPIIIHSQALATARHTAEPPPAVTSIQV